MTLQNNVQATLPDSPAYNTSLRKGSLISASDQKAIQLGIVTFKTTNYSPTFSSRENQKSQIKTVVGENVHSLSTSRKRKNHPTMTNQTAKKSKVTCKKEGPTKSNASIRNQFSIFLSRCSSPEELKNIYSEMKLSIFWGKLSKTDQITLKKKKTLMKTKLSIEKILTLKFKIGEKGQ